MTERSSPASPASSSARPDRLTLAGPSRRPDPRIHAYRPDLADIRIAHQVFAPHYARAETWGALASIPMKSAPSHDAVAVSELLTGEDFDVLDSAGGWSWGQSRHDGYVGYVSTNQLGSVVAATHRVAVPVALVFKNADIKSPVATELPIGSRVAGRVEGDFLALEDNFFAPGHIHLRHLEPIGAVAADPVLVAERLIGMPYMWGGRGGGGIDCSGLVQLALSFAGIAAPRDSDQQRTLGEATADGAALRRGDLVFFPGHVGLMTSPESMIHANAYWMAVTVEPLADIVARLASTHEQPILARRRIAW